MMTKQSETELNARQMTAEQLFHLGVQDVAYVKTVDDGSTTRYAVHNAEGDEIGIFADRDVAFAAVRQHDLEPLSLH